MPSSREKHLDLPHCATRLSAGTGKVCRIHNCLKLTHTESDGSSAYTLIYIASMYPASDVAGHVSFRRWATVAQSSQYKIQIMYIFNLITRGILLFATFDWLCGGLYRSYISDLLYTENAYVLGAAVLAVAIACTWQLLQLMGLAAHGAEDMDL